MAAQVPVYRVLIIDDNPAIHEDFEKILTHQEQAELDELESELFGGDQPNKTMPRFELGHAFQGKEGWQMIEEARKQGNPYSLAFVDMRMPPGWDGLQTIERLFASHGESALQVVICTAYSDHSWEDIQRRAGHTDRLLILKKPFDSIEIRQVAHALTEKSRLEAQQSRRFAELDELVNRRTAELEAANAKLQQQIAERDRIEVELRMAQKLEAVGQLASGIAHEINTPIQFIGDSTHFLQASFEDLQGVLASYREVCGKHVPSESLGRVKEAEEEADLGFLEEQVPKAIERALDGIDRVSTIVRAMKEFAHPGGSEKTPIDLNDAVKTTLAVACNEYKYVADVEVDLGDLPPVPCYPGEVNQVLLNLIVNAAHAIADAQVDADHKGLIHIGTSRIVDGVEVRIKDTGTGIPSEVQDRIFDPFFTTKEVGKGTGQGLAIAHSIVVDKHGGELKFETEQGKGTTFFIRLPIGEAARAAA